MNGEETDKRIVQLLEDNKTLLKYLLVMVIETHNPTDVKGWYEKVERV